MSVRTTRGHPAARRLPPGARQTQALAVSAPLHANNVTAANLTLSDRPELRFAASMS